MENPSIGRQVVPRGPTDRQTKKETDMTNQIVTLRSFVSALKMTEKETKRY
jgi:hypothetical protein